MISGLLPPGKQSLRRWITYVFCLSRFVSISKLDNCFLFKLNMESVNRVRLEEIVKQVGSSIPDDAKISNLQSMGAIMMQPIPPPPTNVLSVHNPAPVAPPPAPPPLFGGPGAPPPPPPMGMSFISLPQICIGTYTA